MDGGTWWSTVHGVTKSQTWLSDFTSTSLALKLVQFSCSVVSDSLQPHGLKHSRLPCSSPTPGACSNSRPLSQWCHPTVSSSHPFSSCLQPFPASGSFPMSQFFTSGGQSIGASASASVLSMNIHDWFPLEWTGLTSLLRTRALSLSHSLSKLSHDAKHDYGAGRHCKSFNHRQPSVTDHLTGKVQNWELWFNLSHRSWNLHAECFPPHCW